MYKGERTREVWWGGRKERSCARDKETDEIDEGGREKERLGERKEETLVEVKVRRGDRVKRKRRKRERMKWGRQSWSRGGGQWGQRGKG